MLHELTPISVIAQVGKTKHTESANLRHGLFDKRWLYHRKLQNFKMFAFQAF